MIERINQKYRSIPNLLSIYRIIVAPILLLVSIYGYKNLFLILFALSVLSDFLDGFIARTLHSETEYGSRLDTWGDTFTFGFLPMCFYFLWPEIIYREMYYVLLAIISIIFPLIYGYHKYKIMISYHTFISKLSVLMISLSTFSLALFHINTVFHIAAFLQLIAGMELVGIIAILPTYEGNVKSLLHVIKSKREL